jgi:transposase, IS30 family
MGLSYKQLSLEERIEIYRLHAGGISRTKISQDLGRAVSTISRELRRNGQPTNAWRHGYEPVRAHWLAARRRRWDCRFKLARQPALQDRVGRDLAMGHSPEQIAGRLALEHGSTLISHESIYRFVYHRSAQKDYWHRLLPRQKLKRGRPGRQGGSAAGFIKLRRPISERPAEVQTRQTPGHWEADFMLFSKYGQNLLVLHERQTRFTIVGHPDDRKAPTTVAAITQSLTQIPKAIRKTISFDNGTEFAEHYRLHASLGVQTYFCDPHSPWQKGGIENAIGRLRRSLPRKTDLSALSPLELDNNVQRLNSTPRKCLGFKTPAEAFSKLTSTVALQT